MSDTAPSAAPHEVPGQARDDEAASRPHRYRHWTRARMVAFLHELAATRSVAAAARSVEMSRQSAYMLRARLSRSRFVEAWDFALAAPRGAIPPSRSSVRHPVSFSELARWKDRELPSDELSLRV